MDMIRIQLWYGYGFCKYGNVQNHVYYGISQVLVNEMVIVFFKRCMSCLKMYLVMVNEMVMVSKL